MLDAPTTASGARIIAELIHGHGVSRVFFAPAILRNGLASARIKSTRVSPCSRSGAMISSYGLLITGR
jgi:hypothetical protein